MNLGTVSGFHLSVFGSGWLAFPREFIFGLATRLWFVFWHSSGSEGAVYPGVGRRTRALKGGRLPWLYWDGKPDAPNVNNASLVSAVRWTE